MVAALLLTTLPAMAVTPAKQSSAPHTQAATSKPAPHAAAALDTLAQVDVASADTAPLAAQLGAFEQASPSTSARVKKALQGAFALLGTPYRWGGSSPEAGFDCSGLVGYVFRTIGIDLPRVSRAMASSGTAVDDRTSLAEGDLVFFGKRGQVDHVGIYIGQGKFLHAPRTGRDVTVSSLETGYWSQKYMQARRVASGS